MNLGKNLLLFPWKGLGNTISDAENTLSLNLKQNQLMI